MDEALDVRTWLTIAGVVFAFFLVPVAMLAYDRRQQRRQQQGQQPSDPTDQTDLTAPAHANRPDTGRAGAHRRDDQCR